MTVVVPVFGVPPLSTALTSRKYTSVAVASRATPVLVSEPLLSMSNWLEASPAEKKKNVHREGVGVQQQVRSYFVSRILTRLQLVNMCGIGLLYDCCALSAYSIKLRRHSFVEIGHEIFSTVVLSLPLIQEGQLSVSGERMCTILVNHLED